MKQAIRLPSTLLLVSLPARHDAAACKPVKVYLPVGPLNMEGKPPNALIDHQARRSPVSLPRQRDLVQPHRPCDGRGDVGRTPRTGN